MKNTNCADYSALRATPPRLLNVVEASKYIGISERTIRSWISDRKIRVSRIGGRVVIRLVDIDRWIEKHLEGGVA
jgi:excisionase family DNA binding protein